MNRSILSFLLILTAVSATGCNAADEQGETRVVSDSKEDERAIRVDCQNLGIVGDGFGGAYLSCSDRLSLYATFNCFPMKRERVEATCPDWAGLKADVDWQRVSELIDKRAAERAAELEWMNRSLARHPDKDEESSEPGQ